MICLGREGWLVCLDDRIRGGHFMLTVGYSIRPGCKLDTGQRANDLFIVVALVLVLSFQLHVYCFIFLFLIMALVSMSQYDLIGCFKGTLSPTQIN